MKDIYDTLSKLRALQASSNLNEAKTAAAMAEKIIQKYRISEAEIKIEDEIIIDNKPIYSTGKVIMWKNGFISKLAKQYCCSAFIETDYSSGRKKSHYFIAGTKEDVKFVNHMYTWLSLEIERLSKLQCKGEGLIASLSYCQGCVDGIMYQLQETKKEIDLENSNALVFLDERMDKTISYLRKNLNLQKNTTVSKTHVDRKFKDLGFNDGKNIHLGKLIGE